ncbi:ABC transporter substrate-binding protein [Propionibacteriaceae bacterium G57]|uniref:ABC transporter substrate-binding protein n=1 Tax=Aestuariimicrobium sp. G57 TaxID=3418485 RepID=UPI003DA7A600
MRRIRNVAVGFLCAAALVLSACSPGETEAGPSASNTDARQGVQELTYLYFTDGPDEQATRDLIAKYEKEKGVKVKLEIIPFANLEQTLQARLSGGNAPDVARLTSLTNFRDDLLDLNQFQKEALDGKFIEGFDAAANSDGKRLAVPSDLTINGLFVNEDQFKKAGVPIPEVGKAWKSWQEMVDAANKVKAANKTEYAVAADVSGHRFSTMLSQYGTTLISADGKSAAVDQTKTTKMLTDLKKWNSDGTMPRDLVLQAGSKYKAANEIFLAGQTPVYLSGNWQIGAFAKNAKFTWRALPNACEERCGGFPGGKFMAGFKQSKNPALAAEFIAWMNSTDNQKQMVADANFLPTRTDLLKADIPYKTRPADMKVYVSEIETTPADTYVSAYSPAFSNSAKALVTAIAEVLADKTTPEAAAAKLKTDVEGAIKDAG